MIDWVVAAATEEVLKSLDRAVSSLTSLLLYTRLRRYNHSTRIHAEHRPKRLLTASDGIKAYMLPHKACLRVICCSPDD